MTAHSTITYPPTPPNEPSFEIVDPSAIEDVLCVLDAAARWLNERGIEQWPVSFMDNNGWRVDALTREAERGNVFLSRFNGHPIATVTLTDWADPHFAQVWPDGPGDALYLMRLASTQTARNLGLHMGAMLIDYAKYLCSHRGLSKVRLDCSKTNTVLQNYYRDHGFRHVATVDRADRKSGALFEWCALGEAPE